MNRKLLFFTILLILVFTSLPCTLAQTQEIGIQIDDLFVYDIVETVNGETNHWIKGVMVVSVSGSLISVTDTDTFENGTQSRWYQNTYEVSTSTTNPYFFFANLNVSDTVYITNEGTISVIETVSRSYDSGNRETNYITYNDLNDEDITIETYFDKEIGVLVEAIQKDTSTNHEIHLTLKDTNVWTVTEPTPTPTPLPTQPATGSPTPTPSSPTPTPSASSTPTPDSNSGIFLSYEMLYVIIGVIAVVVAGTVLAVVLKRRKK